jgi:hypothetical protein
MSSDNPIPGKIGIGSRGLGVVDPALLDQRAAELARMDGRTAFDERDLAQARAELLGEQEPPDAPEIVAPESESVRSWEDLEAGAGSQAPTAGPDDEQTVAEQLFEDGVEEADHDIRLSASETMDQADEEP